MGTLLLIIFIVFVVVPLMKASVAIYRARRAAHQFFRQFTGQQQQSSRRSTHNQQPQPAPKAKKINAEDGVFVAYEDLPADSQTDKHQEQQTHNDTIVVEQQIVDVEWEEIN